MIKIKSDLANLKERLNGLMESLRESNPNANWKNLSTGVLILVLVAVFSVWYFGQSGKGQNGVDKTLENIGDVVKGVTGDKANEEAVAAQPVKEAAVEEGEGLWHVAQRVCGDGEAYSALASANGLTVWSEVYAGQKLVVACSLPDAQ